MIEQSDRAHHDSMLNRLAIMEDALKKFREGRSRMAGVVAVISATNAEVTQTMYLAWLAVHDPRWQAAAHFRFVAQRYAELALCYTLIQNSYDELCAFGLIAKEDRAEPTSRDIAAAAAAEEKLTKKRRRERAMAA